jgi:hypothetical protein
VATLLPKFNERGVQSDSFRRDFGGGDAEFCGCADFVGCERGSMVRGDCFGVCEGFEVGFLRGGEGDGERVWRGGTGGVGFKVGEVEPIFTES